jgi:hypothetical protein
LYYRPTLAPLEKMVNTLGIAAKSAIGISLSFFHRAQDASLFMLVFYCVRFSTPKNYGGLGRSTSVRRVLVSGKANPVQFTTLGLASERGDLKTSQGGHYADNFPYPSCTSNLYLYRCELRVQIPRFRLRVERTTSPKYLLRAVSGFH